MTGTTGSTRRFAAMGIAVIVMASGATGAAAGGGTSTGAGTTHVSGMSSAVASGIVVNGVARTLRMETTSTRTRIAPSGRTVRVGSGAAFAVGTASATSERRHAGSHHAVVPMR